jgi:hypothetical protein
MGRPHWMMGLTNTAGARRAVASTRRSCENARQIQAANWWAASSFPLVNYLPVAPSPAATTRCASSAVLSERIEDSRNHRRNDPEQEERRDEGDLHWPHTPYGECPGRLETTDLTRPMSETLDQTRWSCVRGTGGGALHLSGALPTGNGWERLRQRRGTSAPTRSGRSGGQ